MLNNDHILINKTKPYLIDKNILNKVTKSNIDNKLSYYLMTNLREMIYRNKLYLLFILLIVIFLLYRYLYYSKKLKINDKKVKDLTNIDDIIAYYN